MWVLDSVYEVNSAGIAAAIEMLPSHEHLTLQDEDTVAYALDLYRCHSSLGFSDCLMLEFARKHGHLPLGRFDRGLGKRARAQTLR
jgi:predicted nucleic-acid-binding protein